MRNTGYNIFSVVGSNPKWEWLVGYTARSKSIDHFLRHISLRHKKICNMSQLNNAHHSRDIIVSILDDVPKRKKYCQADDAGNIKMIDEYSGEYGYVIEVLDNGTTKKILFATEGEANEWKKIFQSK